MAVARVTPTEKKRPRCSGRAFQNACCSGESSRRASRRVGRVCEWMRQMDLALYRGMFVGGRGKRVTRDWVTGSLGESRKGRVRIAHGQARGQSRHLFTQSGEKDKEGAVKQRVHALINLHLGPGSPAIIFWMIENRH